MKSLLVCFLVFLSLSVFSQDFEVTPLQLFFNAEPGESQTRFIKIRNHNSTQETFIISLSDLAIDSKGKTTYEDMGSMKNSLADWLSFAPSFFELSPNEEQEIAVTIQQPADEYGSKWGILFVKTAKEQTTYSADKNVAAGISLSARIAIDVFQTPGTNKSYKATIGNMSQDYNEGDSLRTVNAIVNNLGDIITTCKVFLIATNIETAEETTFPEKEFAMYPKSSRKIELYMPNNLPKGTYSLAAILDYGSKTNLEGTQMILKIE